RGGGGDGGQGGPRRPPQIGGRAGAGSLHLRCGPPLQKAASRDEQTPQRPSDGIGGDPRLVHEEDDGEQRLPSADHRVGDDRQVIGAPATVERRAGGGEENGEGPRGGGRQPPQHRPAPPRSREPPPPPRRQGHPPQPPPP